ILQSVLLAADRFGRAAAAAGIWSAIRPGAEPAAAAGAPTALSAAGAALSASLSATAARAACADGRLSAAGRIGCRPWRRAISTASGGDRLGPASGGGAVAEKVGLERRYTGYG